MEFTDRLIGGKYQVERKIAEGGMGAVYRAQHNLTKKTVALKILFPHIGKDEAARQRFLREVSAPATIGHDGIVEVYDAGFDSQDGSLFVAMELLEGDTVRDRLDRGGLTMEQLLDLFEEMLDPLAAAHERGIVHRDLKPENAFLNRTKDGREVLKILDFGIARDLDSSKENVTHTGIAMGTPHYMAPEQAMSAKGVTAAADVWALGVMLYEALSGRTPFDGETASAIVVHACTQPHPPLKQVAPQVPAPLALFVDRCLSKDPEHRPANARLMLEELRAVRAQLSGGVAAQVPMAPTAPAMAMPSVATPTPTGGGRAVAPTAAMPAGMGSSPGFGGAPGSSPGFGGAPGSSPGFGGAPGSSPGFGGAPGSSPGFGSAPGSSPGQASAPGFPGPAAVTPPVGAASFGTAAAQPTPGSSGIGRLAIGGIVLLLGGGLCVLAMIAVTMRGGDEPGTVQGPQGTVFIAASQAGELIVDGESLGPIQPGHQLQLGVGGHDLELRVNGSPVGRAQVQVTEGQSTTANLNPTGGGGRGGPVVGTQTLTGMLQQGDETYPGRGLADRYNVEWSVGEQHVVSMNASFDTYLILISPSGQHQLTDDDGGDGFNSRLQLTVPEAGRWTIVATVFSSADGGPYTLTIQ